MNTPKKPEPTRAQVAQLLAQHGIDPARVSWVADPDEDAEASLEANPLLDDYTHLTDVALRRVREPAEGLFISESSKIIQRAHAAGHTFRSFLLSPRWIDSIAQVLAASAAPIYLGTEAQLEQLTGFHLHRGALASTRRTPLPEPAELLQDARRIVVVEDIVDHTNLGAIFRSAAGFDIDAVLLTPRAADPLYRRSIRVSMGTVFQVPWTRLPDWPGGTELLRTLGFHMAALALDDDAVSLQEFAAAPPDKVALVMGTEGDGLRPATIAAADSTVMIPMSHGVDSLNVAAATAVACFALQRKPQ